MSDALDNLGKAEKGKDYAHENTRKIGSASKGGRPKKSSRDKRVHKIAVSLSSAELKKIIDYCESIGAQPAAFLRSKALDFIEL
jgi:hypothetical protein